MPGLFFRILSLYAVITVVFGDPNSGIGRDSRHAVENHLLAMMGLKRRPRQRNKPIVIPPYMLELFKQKQLEDMDPEDIEDEEDIYQQYEKNAYGANTVRSFLHDDGYTVDQQYTWKPHQYHLKFNVASIPAEEQFLLLGTELRLFRRASKVNTPHPRKIRDVSFREMNQTERLAYKKPFLKRISVLDVMRVSENSTDEPVTMVLDTKYVDVRKSSTEVLDIIPAVKRWLKEPTENHGIIVEVTDIDGEVHPLAEKVRLRRSVRESNSKWVKEQPLLVAYIEDIQARERRRRNAQRRHKIKGQRQACERRKLYVDFKEVGWQDWIVAPPGYNAYFCQGDCPIPLSDHFNATNHAIVQNIMNSVNPSVAKPCCIPTELSSIAMLYLDDHDNVVLKNYQEMVVQACGCR